MGHLQGKHQNKMSDSDLRSFIETKSFLTEWIVPTEFMGFIIDLIVHSDSPQSFVKENPVCPLHLNSPLHCALQCRVYSTVFPPKATTLHHEWLTFSHLLLMLSSLEKTTAAMVSTNKFLPMIGPEHSGHS